MDLVVAPRIADKPSEGIAIYDNDSPGPPVLVISEDWVMADLKKQLDCWLTWSYVAKNVVDPKEDQMPKSYGGSK